jgi:hypothetical protein
MTDIIALDISAGNEVWLRSDRICSRSESPQRNAGKALKSLGVTDCTIHFRKWGRVVRAVKLSKLLREDAP